MKNSVLCYLEETAVKFPDKLAISDGELSVTFSEWRQRALCLADAITAKLSGSASAGFSLSAKGNEYIDFLCRNLV